MSLHVAENHCGGFYFVSADEVDEVEEYCETCSDHDNYIGEFENIEEIRKRFEYSPFSLYDKGYLEEFLKEEIK